MTKSEMIREIKALLPDAHQPEDLGKLPSHSLAELLKGVQVLARRAERDDGGAYD